MAGVKVDDVPSLVPKVAGVAGEVVGMAGTLRDVANVLVEAQTKLQADQQAFQEWERLQKKQSEDEWKTIEAMKQKNEAGAKEKEDELRRRDAETVAAVAKHQKEQQEERAKLEAERGDLAQRRATWERQARGHLESVQAKRKQLEDEAAALRTEVGEASAEVEARRQRLKEEEIELGNREADLTNTLRQIDAHSREVKAKEEGLLSKTAVLEGLLQKAEGLWREAQKDELEGGAFSLRPPVEGGKGTQFWANQWEDTTTGLCIQRHKHPTMGSLRGNKEYRLIFMQAPHWIVATSDDSNAVDDAKLLVTTRFNSESELRWYVDCQVLYNTLIQHGGKRKAEERLEIIETGRRIAETATDFERLFSFYKKVRRVPEEDLVDMIGPSLRENLGRLFSKFASSAPLDVLNATRARVEAAPKQTAGENVMAEILLGLVDTAVSKLEGQPPANKQKAV